MPRLRQQVRAFRLLSLCDGMIALIATRFAQDLQLSFKIMQHMSRAPAEGEAACGRAAIEGFLFALYRPSRQARCTMPINDASSEAPVVMVTLPYDLWRLGPAQRRAGCCSEPGYDQLWPEHAFGRSPLQILTRANEPSNVYRRLRGIAQAARSEAGGAEA